MPQEVSSCRSFNQNL